MSSSLRMDSTSSTVTCRLCATAIPGIRATGSVFTPTGLLNRWPQRIESLLELSVHNDGQLLTHMCSKCRSKVQQLEKASSELTEFKELANNALIKARAQLTKRPKNTSDDGVSPDTARLRPRCKISRKRLDFDCKIIMNTKLCIEVYYIGLPQRNETEQDTSLQIATSPIAISQVIGKNTIIIVLNSLTSSILLL